MAQFLPLQFPSLSLSSLAHISRFFVSNDQLLGLLELVADTLNLFLLISRALVYLTIFERIVIL